MRWLLPQVTQDQAAALAAALQLHLPARILVHRGYQTPEAAHAFLADGLADLPDPFRMKGMRRRWSVTRALRAPGRRSPSTATTTWTGCAPPR